jgi:2-polyprenyl-6-methoxyphenol hydroxylase-like FAD-dependent oxidoreductase
MDALVVGAGPTGLLMAAELTRHGLEVRVIDRNEHGATESRALAIHARTVELLDDLGLAGTFVQRGLRAGGVSIWSSSGERLAHVKFDGIGGPFPFVLDLPQSETEALLERHLEQLGVTVQRRTELVAFEQDSGFVRATLRSPAGEEAVEVPWAIGCDGSHSSIRHGLGIGFEGATVELDWGIADVALQWPLAGDEMHMFLLEDGLLATFPMPEGRWRLIAEIGPSGAGEPPSTPDLDFFAAYLRRTGHAEATVADPHWLAAFRVNERQASHVRDRRAFIAGDAAHVHSPAGGQGMNTGLQDAYNLAWKLALVERGHAPAALLDTYETERWPVAQRVVKQTSALFRMALIGAPAARRLRDAALRHVAALAPVQRRLLQSISERDVNYRDSPIVAEYRRPHDAPRAGDLAPDADPQVRDALRGTEYVLLTFGDEPVATLIAKEYRGLVRAAAVPSAREAFGGAALCLVRPDGYVGFIAGEVDEAALRGYLDRVLIAHDQA